MSPLRKHVDNAQTPLVDVASVLAAVPKLDFDNIPDHIAIIMDGNARWAKQHNLPSTQGYLEGAKRAQEIILTAQAMGIRYLTLFAFSKENWGRPTEEIDTLCNLLVSYLPAQPEDNFFIKHRIRLQVMGTLGDFPDILQQRLQMTCAACQDYQGLTVVIGLSYGSRQAIAEAVQSLAQQCLKGEIKPEQITPQAISNALSTRAVPALDLLIRSSGELRISNFMIWELAYAELYFTTVLWPDFSSLHFAAALESFARRNRRFGQR